MRIRNGTIQKSVKTERPTHKCALITMLGSQRQVEQSEISRAQVVSLCLDPSVGK